MCEAVGLRGASGCIARATVRSVSDPLARGMWRELSSEEVRRLRQASARARPRPRMHGRERGTGRPPRPAGPERSARPAAPRERRERFERARPPERSQRSARRQLRETGANASNAPGRREKPALRRLRAERERRAPGSRPSARRARPVQHARPRERGERSTPLARAKTRTLSTPRPRERGDATPLARARRTSPGNVLGRSPEARARIVASGESATIVVSELGARSRERPRGRRAAVRLRAPRARLHGSGQPPRA